MLSILSSAHGKYPQLPVRSCLSLGAHGQTQRPTQLESRLAAASPTRSRREEAGRPTTADGSAPSSSFPCCPAHLSGRSGTSFRRCIGGSSAPAPVLSLLDPCGLTEARAGQTRSPARKCEGTQGRQGQKCRSCGHLGCGFEHVLLLQRGRRRTVIRSSAVSVVQTARAAHASPGPPPGARCELSKALQTSRASVARLSPRRCSSWSDIRDRSW